MKSGAHSRCPQASRPLPLVEQPPERTFSNVCYPRSPASHCLSVCGVVSQHVDHEYNSSLSCSGEWFSRVFVVLHSVAVDGCGFCPTIGNGAGMDMFPEEAQGWPKHQQTVCLCKLTSFSCGLVLLLLAGGAFL